jgi:hypothetical protein
MKQEKIVVVVTRSEKRMCVVPMYSQEKEGERQRLKCCWWCWLSLLHALEKLHVVKVETTLKNANVV